MRPFKTTCYHCGQTILMIKSGSKTRKADPIKATFVFDSTSDARFITESGDVVCGVAVVPGGEQQFDLMRGYPLHRCVKEG